jgi:hypothetical protein
MFEVELSPLAHEHRQALEAAVEVLEHPNLVARLAEYAGAPVSRILKLLPTQIDRALTKAVEGAMLRCLKTAIRTLDLAKPRGPRSLLPSLAAGVTGGVGGFMGIAGLPFELPVTTTLMLRAIADIARDHGEDLSQPEARLACLEVFALGGRPDDAKAGLRGDIGYFATRAMLTRMTGGSAAQLVQRGAVELSGMTMNKFLAELVSRFSVVVSDRLAASAVPVVGAIGGAAVNVIFMNHFQRIARGHFAVRSLERRYGSEVVRRHYAEIAARTEPQR